MNEPTEKIDFTIAQQWGLFLKRAGFKPGELPRVQEIELSKAFYAGVGQLLFMMRDDIPPLGEEEGSKKLTAMVNEIALFWKEKTEEYVREQKENQKSDNKGEASSPAN